MSGFVQVESNDTKWNASRVVTHFTTNKVPKSVVQSVYLKVLCVAVVM